MSRTAEALAQEGTGSEHGPVPVRRADGTVHGGTVSHQGIAPPAPASDLELLGAFSHSGHRSPPALVRRGDGQIVQLTPVLYEVLAVIDGQRGYDEIAARVGAKVARLVMADDIAVLIEKKLRPLGLLRETDGSEPVVHKANPLLALRFRKVVTDTQITSRIAGAFEKLFHPPVVTPVLLAFLLTIGWLFFAKGLAAPMRHALYEPGPLLLVFALTTLSAGFHELGHAAACKYGGARPGAMGVGLYLLWPAFYTDVTDSYRLDRRGRLRVDLGGMYFNAVFAIVAFGLWAVTGWDALLIVVPLQALQMLRHLIPLVRLDGYHILADLTGVPDLFAHIKPILKSMLPVRNSSAEASRLRPWARAVVTLWVLLVVPILAFTFFLIASTLPRVVATAWDSLGRQWHGFNSTLGGGDYVGSALAALAMFALVVPAASMCYLFVRVIRRTAQRVWRGTADHPAKRVTAIVAAIALVAGLATLWWPNGQYEPITAQDRATFLDVRFKTPALFDRDGASGIEARLPIAVSDTIPVPAVGESPPAIGEDSEASGEPVPAPGSEVDHSFTLPPPPGEGDNQALAVNYDDGTVIADVAFQLLTLAGLDVDNVNEAYALASCAACATVAVAFQIILVLDQADIVVPQNVAVALNAYCETCLTYAVAMQLIVSLDEPLSKKGLKDLEALAARLEELEASIADMTPEELLVALAEIETEILTVLTEEGASILGTSDIDELVAGPEAAASPTSSPTPSQSAGTTAESSPTATEEPSPSPSEEPSSSPSPEPSQSPAEEPSPEPTP